MHQKWITPQYDADIARTLSDQHNMPLALCILLTQRGITSSLDVQQFFKPSLNDLHNPFLMADMREAVERLQSALFKGERILLYGDYDVDGTTSVALMYAFLSGFYRNLDYYLPNRDKEGYGVSMEGVEYARLTGCTLVIAMDCGIKAHEAIAQASKHGIDFIVCDHHVPEGGLPGAVANLDPKRADCPYPFKELSGCGIAFKLAQALTLANNTPAEELEPLLDLVALSIACDVVPMIGENRILANFGLQKINQSARIGVNALIQSSNKKRPMGISDLVFGLGPLINAAGRIGDARDAVRLLLSADRTAAIEATAKLKYRNEQRKEFDYAILAQARASVSGRENLDTTKSIVLFDPGWHKGVIGITASRIAEDFHRPTVVLTQSNGRAVGSARSVPGFDLYDALHHCEELLHTYGGHAHAAGLQLEVENVPLFERKFEQWVATHLLEASEQPVLEVACKLDFNEITPEFWQKLQQFAPFGPSNMTPVFWAENVSDTGKARIVGTNHIRLLLRQHNNGPVFPAIGFGLSEKYETVKNNPFKIAYTLKEDFWQEKKVLSLQIRDFKTM